jgi:type I restriction enzyme R subunit
VATIFTYTANEEDADADGLIGDPDFNIGVDKPVNVHAREKLDRFIVDYNAMYQTAYSTKDSQSFYNYYKDIAKRMKERERRDFQDKDRVDILLVVNMFLTGFDAKKLNTLYVDKNLRYHGLIQAFSRTNRVLGQVKSQGNIVCFRNLKAKTDEAITLFSNRDAIETVLMAPYEDYVTQFNAAVANLLKIAPDVESVNYLQTDGEVLAFVQAFRELIRIRNVLGSFIQFSPDDLTLDPQIFEDYKSKYLDIYDRTKRAKESEAVSIIDEVDFELELIQRDEINVAYILGLLAEVSRDANSLDATQRDESARKRKLVMDMLGSEAQLRSKRELIERFIEQHMPKAQNSGASVEETFLAFWNDERVKAMEAVCAEEGIPPAAFQRLVEDYQFTGKPPLREAVIDALEQKPKILERRKITERITEKLLELVATFDDGLGGI